MTTEIQRMVITRARGVWGRLVREYPELQAHDMPTIKLNGRLWRTAGRCFQDLQIVEFGTKFFTFNADYQRNMLRVIVPHEIIHAADWILHGESNKPCGHGTTWQKMMVNYGLEPDPFHQMWIPR